MIYSPSIRRPSLIAVLVWSIALGMWFFQHAWVEIQEAVLVRAAQAVDSKARSGSPAKDNLPAGRVALPTKEGDWPASYFPNTEELAPDEMRITALGTGMPNQTRRAVFITAEITNASGPDLQFACGTLQPRGDCSP